MAFGRRLTLCRCGLCAIVEHAESKPNEYFLAVHNRQNLHIVLHQVDLQQSGIRAEQTGPEAARQLYAVESMRRASAQTRNAKSEDRRGVALAMPPNVKGWRKIRRHSSLHLLRHFVHSVPNAAYSHQRQNSLNTPQTQQLFWWRGSRHEHFPHASRSRSDAQPRLGRRRRKHCHRARVPRQRPRQQRRHLRLRPAEAQEHILHRPRCPPAPPAAASPPSRSLDPRASPSWR
mmetsp:Transcript_29648/g.72106  ORF Transcript_29648/g.72106 Transcript_29648/m.72106 type:complete len:232 (-) Transcript_29648:73-768(-)